jgi:hypothetical protein
MTTRPAATAALCSAFAAASPFAVLVRSHCSHVYVRSANSRSGERVAPVAERALGELHDVALVHERHALPFLAQRVLDGGAHQPLAAVLRHGLHADAGRLGKADLLVGRREVGLEQPEHLLRVVGAGGELDARVDVLRVLAEDHHVDLVGTLHRRGHALEPAHGPQAHVEIEDLPHRDVQRADAAADGRRERALDADEIGAERIERRIRQPVAGLVERLLAGEHLVPRDLPLAAVRLVDRGIEHAYRRAPDVGAGAVALDERNDRVGGDVHPSPTAS